MRQFLLAANEKVYKDKLAHAECRLRGALKLQDRQAEPVWLAQGNRDRLGKMVDL